MLLGVWSTFYRGHAALLIGLLITDSYSASHMYANRATLATGMVTMICSFLCAATSVSHVLGLHKARAGKDKYIAISQILSIFLPQVTRNKIFGRHQYKGTPCLHLPEPSLMLRSC